VISDGVLMCALIPEERKLAKQQDPVLYLLVARDHSDRWDLPAIGPSLPLTVLYMFIYFNGYSLTLKVVRLYV